MKKRIFNLLVLIVSLALLSSASGAAAQKPTQSTPYHPWDDKEVATAQEQSWRIRLLGQYKISEEAIGVAVAGDYAYVAYGHSGLRIVDISDPTVPTETGFYDASFYAEDVAVAGGYAYITDRDGLHIINVSDPTAPTETGYYDAPTSANGVAVAGNYAYIADIWEGLLIIDVSNPTAPNEIGSYNTTGDAQGVTVAENYAYVADGQGGLQIIEISNPAAPSGIGFFDTPGNAYGVAVAGDYAYVADAGSGLRVIDITNPAAPVEAGFYDTPGETYDVAVAGDYAYIADINNGLRIIDVSNPASLTEAGFYDTPGYAIGIAVAGDYDAYVADGGGGLVILRFFPYQIYQPLAMLNFCPNFFDDFSDPASGWDVVDNEYERTEYLNGEYRVQPKQDGYVYYYPAPTCSRENYIVEIDARWFSTPGGSYGIFFGALADYSGYYIFEVENDWGEFSVYRFETSGWTQVVPWTYSYAINDGNTSNHLKVTRDGKQFTLEANGVVLGTWSDDSLTGPTKVGVFTHPYYEQPTYDARFDNFSVQSLPGSSMLLQLEREAFDFTSSPDITTEKQHVVPAPNTR